MDEQKYQNLSPDSNPGAAYPAPASDKSTLRSIFSTILFLLLAPLLALTLTLFVFQSYEVDGPSMQQTLQNHDRLIVLKVPRTWARITHHNYIPHRYDIIVFTKHGLFEGGVGQDKQLIKRVIGLPGEHVVVKDGTITVYNSQHPGGFNPDQGQSYSKSIVTTPGTVDITVPDGELFVSGDNRTNSLDSRFFGTVPASDVVGKLALRIFPFSQATGGGS